MERLDEILGNIEERVNEALDTPLRRSKLAGVLMILAFIAGLAIAA